MRSRFPHRKKLFLSHGTGNCYISLFENCHRPARAFDVSLCGFPVKSGRSPAGDGPALAVNAHSIRRTPVSGQRYFTKGE